MNRLDDDRALAHGRGDPFHRTRADVSHGRMPTAKARAFAAFVERELSQPSAG
ncbi:hypothetical protein [Phenylobacterium sp.]|uniref:hypothetical protein n=1 Tax=Phenylobacterium sp. TaxID=1871053 RepID=UPI0026201B90|nr:hypothetical protein [Phenylobacterium sp.]